MAAAVFNPSHVFPMQRWKQSEKGDCGSPDVPAQYTGNIVVSKCLEHVSPLKEQQACFAESKISLLDCIALRVSDVDLVNFRTIRGWGLCRAGHTVYFRGAPVYHCYAI